MQSVSLFFYLAVSCGDHVYIVANQFECETSIHEGKTALQTETESADQTTSMYKKEII